MTGTRAFARSVALNLGALLGLLCILVAVAGLVFDLRLLVFRSGSMAPEIPTGAVALTREVPVTDVRVGDVVSVLNSAGTRITHRVVSVDETADGPTLVLQGDANEVPDQQPYTPATVDLVIWHASGVGRAVDVLASPYALVAGGAAVAGLLYLGFARPRADPDHGVLPDGPDSEPGD